MRLVYNDSEVRYIARILFNILSTESSPIRLRVAVKVESIFYIVLTNKSIIWQIIE